MIKPEPPLVMTKPDKLIVDFITNQTVVTIATSVDDDPYCATCFFAYNEEHTTLVFKSSEDTEHIKQGLINSSVAGSVLPDKLLTGKVKGLQFKGILGSASTSVLIDLKKTYYKKYPFALAMGGEVWIIDLTWIKYTDNTLGFGKKIEWEKA
ncbi:hypothetical protein ADIARSV_3079 [Arcticibacter svalbardensis MN12-7]|uniref:Uncharacterized protein n=1 Tax=Arcticibacter svalbardensis MN12-7 TaxID=1150600 RepID=R9GXQ7_9SPHI|nr:pyridoxamine 5'-phosphate oxidase family protein [Arcticibacter svalbardensis]EOR93739.1 hypothetical protein ADIARSV_3079 [Arcticibacter svalbardensis MN12-7]